MWDLIVSGPDYCLSFYFERAMIPHLSPSMLGNDQIHAVFLNIQGQVTQ